MRRKRKSFKHDMTSMNWSSQRTWKWIKQTKSNMHWKR
jgi:hypothetical protein